MQNEKSLIDTVISSLYWVAAGKVATQIFRWAITFWVIRILTPEDYGLVAMSDVLFGMLLLTTNSFLTPIIIQHDNVSRSFLGNVFGAAIIIYGSAACFQFFIARYVADYYQAPDVAAILQLNCICFLLLLFKLIPYSLLSKEMMFRQVSMINAVANITAALSTLWMAKEGYGYWSLILGEVIAIGLVTVLAMCIKPVFVFPRLRLKEIQSSLSFGGAMSINALLFYMFMFVDITLAGRVLDAVEIGVFAVAAQLSMMPQKKILPLIRQVAFPAFSSIQDDRRQIAHYLTRAQELSFLITLPVFWGGALIVGEIVPVVLGSRWENVVLPASLLLIIMPLRFSSELFGPALKSQKLSKEILKNTLTHLVILTVSLVYWVDKGAVGLAMAWLCAFPVSYGIVFVSNCRALDISPFELLRKISTTLIPGILMLATGYATLSVVDNGITITVMSVILVSAVTFIGVINYTNREVLVVFRGVVLRR